MIPVNPRKNRAPQHVSNRHRFAEGIRMCAKSAHSRQSLARPSATRLRRLAALPILAATLLLTACGSDGPSGTTPTTEAPDPSRPPAGIHWESYQGIQLPIGADGPKNLGTAATGYTHSPQGAALAAINHNVRLSLAPDTTWPQIASQSLIPGPAKDNWVLSRSQISITSAANPALAPRITAYKINNYSAERADLTVYSTYPDASITSAEQVVLWVSEDWRLLLPDPVAKVPTVHSVSVIPEGVVTLPVVG
ncbi:hypothetical protein ABZ319_00785 [Nocardia sp. NPDC005978]|uniref:hypothetical protein n=1 Tax=Nocardia sp. NPDC005978 TaxID=3156725 RepID=UPI0033AD5CE7